MQTLQLGLMCKYALAINNKRVCCLRMLPRKRRVLESQILMLLFIVQPALVFFWKVEISPDISAAHTSDWASVSSFYCLALAGPRKVHTNPCSEQRTWDLNNDYIVQSSGEGLVWWWGLKKGKTEFSPGTCVQKKYPILRLSWDCGAFSNI